MRNVMIAAIMTVALGLTVAGGVAYAVPIDLGVPPGGYGPEKLPPPIRFHFRTSWDGITWSDEQKSAARAAFSYLGSHFADQPAFLEEPSPDDFSLRWAGADLFKDWGMYGGDSWDYRGTLAMAVKPRPDNSTPWGQKDYPYNEIYFNSTYRWHFNPFTSPEESDPADEDDGEFDFWSVLLHEVIHMLSVEGHAPHPDEVMYPTFSDGETRRQLKESDKQMLRDAGYKIPEPGTAMLVILAAVTATVIRARRYPR